MPYKDHNKNIEYWRKRYRDNKEEILAQQKDYWVHYGRYRFHKIEPDEFEAMYLAQEGKCDICKKDIPLKGKETHIDHDHKTDKVRGLLCAKCNKGLGHFGDDTAILQAAIEYLLKNQ